MFIKTQWGSIYNAEHFRSFCTNGECVYGYYGDEETGDYVQIMRCKDKEAAENALNNLGERLVAISLENG